ncbi:MAG: cistern family PEP-CTERM protein [Cyanobacteria bacterium J06636_16]
MNRRLSAGIWLLSTLSIAVLSSTESAHAFSWNEDNNTITIDDGDAKGQSFDIFFWDAFARDNKVEGASAQELEGLTAEARFTLEEDFDAATGSAQFKVDITNTSDGSIWDSSSIVGFGFGSDPDVVSASSSGVFNSTYVGEPETGVNDIEVCYSNGLSCTTGDQNSGIQLGETASLYTTLKFGQVADTFNLILDEFYVGWQGDSSSLEYSGAADSYGEVPTPALIPGLIGAGLAALRRQQKGADIPA